MFCSKCGAQVDDNSQFCPKCGANTAVMNGASCQKEVVPNHLVGSILSTCCCCVPAGIVAIVYANNVNTKLAQGDVIGARDASKKAKTWIIVSVIVGVIMAVIYGIIGATEGIQEAIQEMQQESAQQQEESAYTVDDSGDAL